MSAFLMAAAPFMLNGVMAFAKYMSGSMTTPGKRFLLAVFSIVGVIMANSLTGEPVQMDSITNLCQIALESLAAFIAAHGSYHLFWKQ